MSERDGSAPAREIGIDRRAFMLALGTFAIGTDAFIIAGILPEIAEDLSTSIGRAGLIVSVFSVSYAVGSPIVSALSVGWHRSTVLIGGLGLFSLANVLSALSPTLIALLATRVLAALTAGLVAPASYALAPVLGSSRNRGKALAILAAGFASALVFGVPLGVLIAKYAGWRGALIFVALLGAIAATFIFVAGVPEPAGGDTTPALRDQLRVMRRPQTAFVLLPFLIWSMANFGLYTFIAAILRRDLPATVVPALLLLFGLGSVAGNFIGGALSDRYGARRPTIAFLAILICALATIDLASSSLIAVGANMIVWGICMAALFTLQQQRVIAVDPAQSNLMLSLSNSALYLGAAIGAAAAGVVISMTSLAFVSPASAGAAALSLAALLLLPQDGSATRAAAAHDKESAPA